MQAIEVLLSTHLDGVLLGDLLVTVAPMPERWWEEVIALAPGVRLRQVWESGRVRTELTASMQGERAYALPEWMFDILVRCARRESLGRDLDRLGVGDERRTEVKEWIHKLMVLKLIVLSNRGGA